VITSAGVGVGGRGGGGNLCGGTKKLWGTARTLKRSAGISKWIVPFASGLRWLVVRFRMTDEED